MRSRRSLVKIDRHVIYKVFPIKKHKRKRCTSPKVYNSISCGVTV